MPISEQQQKNKTIVRSLYEEALNKRNYQLLPELIADEYIGARGVKGAAGIQESIVPLVTAFPDIQWKVEELIGEGDKVTIRWKWRGTHQAAFQSYAATGKVVFNDGMAIYELKDNKIIATRIQTDRLGFLQELGILPLDLSSLPDRKTDKDQVRFIDKFVVPVASKQEFMNRVNINRNFIKTLSGFVEDAAYEGKDEKGNMLFVTIAVWQNEEALKKAKEAMQAEYKKEGFNPALLLERLNITLDRGIYKEATPQP